MFQMMFMMNQKLQHPVPNLNILTESHSSLTSLTGILAKRKRSNFWLKIEHMKLNDITKEKN